MKIVADPNIPYVRDAFAALGDITLIPGRQIDAGSVRDAAVLLVRSVTPVNAALLDGARVQFVATATIGTDHIDEPLLAQRGIGFSSAAGSNANSVAEYIIAALLELGERHKFRLRDKTLGVVGVGNVGSKVVRFARALGMRVLENDPPRQRVENLPDFVSLDQLLREADLVTTHVPLDDTTRRLLHHDNLEDFILLNTARGPVVDNRALLKAIDGDRIPAAVLDVWENEPNLSPELLDVVDLGTPHIAGYSFDGKVAGTRLIYEAACRHFQIPASWQPQLPAPAVPSLELSVRSGDDEEDVLRRVIRRVYAIAADDARLRAAVRDFDKQRAEYPVRREFFNTALTLRDAPASLRAKFAALGFRGTQTA
jgi:erythronate-4-phosphate dehydrogenase